MKPHPLLLNMKRVWLLQNGLAAGGQDVALIVVSLIKRNIGYGHNACRSGSYNNMFTSYQLT